jgi:hypothetical protein
MDQPHLATDHGNQRARARLRGLQHVESELAREMAGGVAEESDGEGDGKEAAMNLYKISQTVNNDYDTYDSAVVAAETEDEARRIHPNSELREPEWDPWHVWAPHDEIKVELIGTAAPGITKGVIVASFNAG